MSRRASLRSLGAAGAALVLCGSDAAALANAPEQAGSVPATPSASPVDVAASRFVKGHS